METADRDAILRAIGGLADRLAGFERRVDERFTSVDGRLARIDTRLEAVEVRMSAVERRLTGVEVKVDSLCEKLLHPEEQRQLGVTAAPLVGSR